MSSSFSASTPFIYLTARKICNKSTALFVAALAISGTVNTYTIYFMPDALYFFSFWVFSWFILGMDSSSASTKWGIAGTPLGLTALIKPHTLCLMPASLLYSIIVLNKDITKWEIKTYRNIVLFVAFIFITKFLLGYILAGEVGLTLFGSFYSAAASASINNLQYFLKLISLSYKSFVGHFLAICLLFGLPLAATIKLTLQSLFSQKPATPSQKISLYTSVILLSLLPVAAVYTASVEWMIHSDSFARLHVRYYNFVFPLFIIVAASRLMVTATVDVSAA